MTDIRLRGANDESTANERIPLGSSTTATTSTLSSSSSSSCMAVSSSSSSSCMDMKQIAVMLKKFRQTRRTSKFVADHWSQSFHLPVLGVPYRSYDIDMDKEEINAFVTWTLDNRTTDEEEEHSFYVAPSSTLSFVFEFYVKHEETEVYDSMTSMTALRHYFGSVLNPRLDVVLALFEKPSPLHHTMTRMELTLPKRERITLSWETGFLTFEDPDTEENIVLDTEYLALLQLLHTFAHIFPSIRRVL